MGMICEKCGLAVHITEGEYLYYQNKIFFGCKGCAKKLNDEMDSCRRICSALDGRKKQAEKILHDRESFEAFLKSFEKTWKKIPEWGQIRTDIQMLMSVIQSSVNGDYSDLSDNTLVVLTATLLYVLSPVDMIPDMIPGAGFTDDAAVVNFCVNMYRDELDRFLLWRENRT